MFGLAGGGGYAEQIVVHGRTVARIPERLSFSEAAAVPEAFITAWDAAVTQAGLTAGETVLIHAAGSGVGTAAVQIARAIGARSIGTARSPHKLERARALGLDVAVLVRTAISPRRCALPAGPTWCWSWWAGLTWPRTCCAWRRAGASC